MQLRAAAIAAVLVAIIAALILSGRSADDRRLGNNLAAPSLAEIEDEDEDDDHTTESSEPGALPQRIRALQEAGLFRGADPDATADRIRRDYRKEWGEPLDTSTIMGELEVAAYDAARVWWEDTELDVLEGNDVWVEVLGEWGRIAGFTAQDVTELWAGEEGPIALRFVLDGETRTIAADATDGWLDMCVLPELNVLLDTDRKLALVEAFDQTAYVIALTPREREILEDRGWRFTTRRC